LRNLRHRGEIGGTMARMPRTAGFEKPATQNLRVSQVLRNLRHGGEIGGTMARMPRTAGFEKPATQRLRVSQVLRNLRHREETSTNDRVLGKFP